MLTPQPEPKACRILIVDDHSAIAALLSDFLSHQPGLAVVAMAHTAEAACAEAEAHRPDLVVLDIGLPEAQKGLEVLRTLRSLYPEMKFLIFSALAVVRMVQESIQLGAHGFLEKTAPLPELLAAVNEVRGGGTYLGSRASELLREVVKGGVQMSYLPVNEVAILKQLSRGAVVKEIATALNMSTSMIYKMLAGLRHRFQARTNEDLLILAFRRGWLEFENQTSGEAHPRKP